MGQKDSVYRKSPQAVEALAKRDPALTPRLRSLLILVDGKRSGEELGRLAPTGAETPQLLAQLHALGMLEVALAAAPEGSDATAAPAARSVSLPDAQRAAVRRLTDLLGPDAAGLCMRIESTRTAQDLLAILQRAEMTVRTARGADAANAFARQMQDFRPG